jgi:hypothetical protein
MRTRSEGDALARLIALARERGVIDATQSDALRSIAGEIAGGADALAAEAGVEVSPVATESRRVFNPVIIAYSAGALLVLFALGWFLADRWRDLGAGGVLAVSAIYTAAFAVTAQQLRRRGFRVGGGLAATLAVIMTPVWAWAILRLAGEWPPNDYNDPLTRYQPWMASRWIVLELATIGAGLIAARRVRFFTIATPIAVAFVAFLIHLGGAIGDPDTSWFLMPYYACLVGCLTFGVAYAIDRRQPTAEDYAVWFYLAAMMSLVVGYIGVWNSIGVWRHALPFVGAVFVVAALYLRRRVLLLAAGLAEFGYLTYLAFDVFRRVVALPIALAGLGLLVIAATVWVQRRFPVLVARISSAGPSDKRLPGGPVAVLGPIAIALTAFLFAIPEARERTVERNWQLRRAHQMELRNQRERRADSAVASPKPSPAPAVRR